ncbi:MAG: cation:proton antiporter [Xanthomonadales bacterium]|jgi:Kef-type K+ transport system membrane component KefB|nr:cation:proton antiporter [Xanthomonadales bacterium]
MNSDTDLIFVLFLILAGSALLGTLMLWARQALIIGYILAGIAVGPWALGWVADTRVIGELSEAGIIFLLFLLGLDLTPQKLFSLFRQTALVTLMTSVVFAVAGALFGLAVGFSWMDSVLVGATCMFSSTIIGIKLLPTTVLHHRHTGEVIISVLLLQDLVAIAVIMTLQAMGQAGAETSDILLPLLALPVLALGGYAVERHVLLPLFRRFDQVQEYIFLVTLAWCLGMAWAGHAAGLSYELGAFIGGVILATSPIAKFIANRLHPLRDFFLVLFFFALGAQLNLDVVPGVLLPAAGLAILMLVLKPLVYRYAFQQVAESRDLAWETGWRLGQMSEFSLLVTFMAMQVPAFSADVIILIQVATVLTIMGSSSIVVFNFPTPVALNRKLRRD